MFKKLYDDVEKGKANIDNPVLGHVRFSPAIKPGMGSPMTPEVMERSDLLTPNDREIDDVSSLAPSTSRKRGYTSAVFPADGSLDSSPDITPSRPFKAPNHTNNEAEA